MKGPYLTALVTVLWAGMLMQPGVPSAAGPQGEGRFRFDFFRPGNKLPPLEFPEDIEVEIFADNVPRGRHMAFDDRGVLFLSQTRKGKVVALPDLDGDGRADRVVTVLEGRGGPHGLAFTTVGDDFTLYIAEEHQVVRLRRQDGLFAFGPPEVIVQGIPGGGHVTRTIRIRDGLLYLSVGSSCNVCIEKDEMRAAISRYDLEGKSGEIFARGLRNTVGMEFSPWTEDLWGVNNGRDRLGDDHPREELNIITRGRHYRTPSP